MAYKIIIFFITFSMVMALPSAQTHAAVSPQCAALETKRQKLNSDLVAKTDPLTQLRVKNTYNNSQVPVLLKTKIATIQVKSDKERAAIFKKLSLKAKTKDQKAAMETYETEYDAALKALRTSQGTAQQAYIKSYDGTFTAHRTAADSQLAALKSKIETAFNTAIAQCQKIGIDKASAQLKSEVNLAQNSYAQAPNVSLTSVQASIDTIDETYKMTNDKALQVFNEAIESSNIKLKVVFLDTKYIFE